MSALIAPFSAALFVLFALFELLPRFPLPFVLGALGEAVALDATSDRSSAFGSFIDVIEPGSELIRGQG